MTGPVTIAGAGAFGTALAIVLAARGAGVTLVARDAATAAAIAAQGHTPRLPGVALPPTLRLAGPEALAGDGPVLLAIPAQALRGFLRTHRDALSGRALVACGKGIDLTTLAGPSAVIADCLPDATAAVLTGPSFAADIARGLPTALTLACADDSTGAALQATLAAPTLRLYRTTDVIGAELGGALKNVIAIACGACIGAGLGDSARAALMTRGFAEMTRLAARLGAQPETLTGLSGFGDLVLTCTSASSRNYSYGMALGRAQDFDPSVTVEGAATARAVLRLADGLGLDLPISAVVAGLVEGRLTVTGALTSLLNRPLKEE